MSSEDSAGLADPAALEDAANRLNMEAVTLRAQTQDWVRPMIAAQWAGAAATSFKDETQAEWFTSSRHAEELEAMARMLRDGAATVRAEIDRRRRAREERERRDREAKKKKAAAAARP